jgi:hypothetical protein
MKYIRKLQQGGFLSYQPTIVSTPTAPPVSSGAGGSSDAKKSSILDDDLIKELTKETGLTNDTNELISQLIQLESQSVNPFLNRNTRAKSLAIIGKINELRQNKAMWSQAYNIAKDSGGLGEIAVSDKGGIYVKDNNGNIGEISPEEYKKNIDKLQALSVADLLEERNSNPLLTGDNKIFNVANNSIGIEKISDYARNVVSALGRETETSSKIFDKDSLSNTMEVVNKDINLTGRKASAGELQGMAILNALKDSPSKYNEVINQSSTERNHALEAAKYIWSTLGTDAQKKLSVQAAINDTDPTKLLLDLIVMGTDTSNSTRINPLKNAKGEGDGSGTNLAHAGRSSNFEMLLKGTFASGSTMKFNDPDYSSKLEGLLLGQMPLVTPEGKPIGPTVLDTIIKNAGYEKYVDTNNMYFGNTKINPWQRKSIALDGSGTLAHVLMPVDNEGRPDMKSLELFRKIYDIYNKNKDSLSPVEIQKMFNDAGFNISIDSNKNIDVTRSGTNVKPFLVTQGYTNSAANDLVEGNDNYNNGGLRRLNDDDNSNMKPILEQA